MTRFLYNLLGTICTLCAAVSLMSLVLRFDYGMAVIIPIAGAAVFFTATNNDSK